MDRQELERWVETQEDIRAIQNLKARYAAFCDDSYNADGIASLFTEDAVWEAPWQGRFEGRGAIREFFRQVSETITFSVHGVLNPIIEVDGDTARASWYLFQPCVINGQAHWVSGRYADEYVKIDGSWYFKSLKVASFFRAQYETGWAAQSAP